MSRYSCRSPCGRLKEKAPKLGARTSFSGFGIGVWPGPAATRADPAFRSLGSACRRHAIRGEMERERTWSDGGQFAGRSQLALFARAEPRKHRGQIFRADIEVLADAAPEHRRRHIAAAALFLRL